jgi:Mg2+ and Co2+ transporter CorA
MSSERERYVLQEIRKRALQRRDDLQRQGRLTQAINDTLDALQEVTELPRTDLETIAAEVTGSRNAERDDFFSIRKQLLMVSTACGALATVIWGLVSWMG